MTAPVIFGCAGTTLTDWEKAFFSEVNPWGFILFARNCETPEQVTALTQELRACVGRDDAPILIDQEGGRVARLKPPHWRAAPPAGKFAEFAIRDMAKARDAVYWNARLIAEELQSLGITVNCAPLLDIPTENSHDIIGDRAFGDTPDLVAPLALSMCEGLMDGGVLPVIKHIPGHGRAMADSHKELPVVDAPLAELRATDFVPFEFLNSMPIAMTAHILYTAIDDMTVSTFSPRVIRLIREGIGFDGVLLSDDLSMFALEGSFSERTERTLTAGCDIVLHCNGDAEEMSAIAQSLPAMCEKTSARITATMACFRAPKEFDVATAEAKLNQVMA